MQKYINGTEIRYFEDDVDVKEWIDLRKFKLMTEVEISAVENPINNLSSEEKRELMKPLTRYQFKRCLLENGFKSSEIEAQILTIEDELKREIVMLGFKEADRFVRTDDSVLVMQEVLGLSPEKIDAMWQEALKL